MKNLVSRFVSDESGVTAIEYGLIAALIAVVIIVAITAVGTSLSTVFTTVSGSLEAVSEYKTEWQRPPPGGRCFFAATKL